MILENLLRTKFYFPVEVKAFVARPRLIQLLNQGLDFKVTLVFAPAGNGKSRLVSQWVNQPGVPVCWLSLDKDDKSPDRFWNYFIGALQAIPTF